MVSDGGGERKRGQGYESITAHRRRGGLVYHALNRANARLALIEDHEDYRAFERVLGEAVV